MVAVALPGPYGPGTSYDPWVNAALLIVQSPKARQDGDIISRTMLFIKNAQQLYIASNS